MTELLAGAATRTVSAQITSTVRQTAEIVFSVTVAHGPTIVEEHLSITVDDEPLPWQEVEADAGGRLHLLRRIPPGKLRLDYRAEVTGHAPAPPLTPWGEILYQRPSRYADSDVLGPIAHAEFKGLTGLELVNAVDSWVNSQLAYVSGSSRPIDGAVDTLLARRGVCRDFAHLVVALLRARGVPARVVAVFAPGLSPMDFHAVAEAYVDGAWHVVDATRLAPRQTMLRIATGRDAADTAFMTVHTGRVDFETLTVGAVVAPTLPSDDHSSLITLG